MGNPAPKLTGRNTTTPQELRPNDDSGPAPQLAKLGDGVGQNIQHSLLVPKDPSILF
jgi:hypothetical protein